MKILNHCQRDELLHNLYQNEELLKFTHGNDWFIDQVFEIWEAYYDHVKMPIRFQNIPQDHAKWKYCNRP